jgi:hypothetical protein
MDYKVNSADDNNIFIETEPYRCLLGAISSMKDVRGEILHVVGAPGTGKSANIYRAISEADLHVYEVPCNLESTDLSADDVLHQLVDGMKEELDADTVTDIYRRFTEFDAVLFADRFHDSHEFSSFTGFSQWTARGSLEPLRFYFKCIVEYLRNRRILSEVNIIFQTAWRFYFRGKKYDLFTDIPVISSLLFHTLSIPFRAIKIDYTREETLNIIRAHLDADESEVQRLIDIYGCRPRIILEKMGSC